MMFKNSTGITHDSLHVLCAVMASMMAVSIASSSFIIAFQEFISHKFHGAEPYVMLDEAAIMLAFVLLFFLPNMMHKYSSKYMLLGIISTMGLCMFLFDMEKDHVWSYVFPAIIIISSKLFFPITTTIIHHHLPDSIRSTFQGFYNVFLGLTFAVSPAFVSFFQEDKDTFYIFAGVICFLFLTPIMLLRTGLDDPDEKKKEASAPKNKWYANFSIIHEHPILYLILFAVAANGAIGSLIVFVGKSYHLDTLALDHMVEIFMLGGVLLSIPAGILADRVGILRLFMGSVALAMVVSAVLAVDTGSQSLNKCMFFLLGGAQANLYLMLFSYMGRMFKGPKLAVVNAGGASFMLASKLIFLQVYGVILDSYGHIGFMYVVCGVNVILLLSFVLATRGHDETAQLKIG